MAEHIANRVKHSILNRTNDKRTVKVLDAFSCVGGNFIQFSKICGFCVGTEIDKRKVESCVKNCEVYGVRIPDEAQILNTDFLKLEEDLQNRQFKFPKDSNDQNFDAVFLDPQWGGTTYSHQSSFPVSNLSPPLFETL